MCKTKVFFLNEYHIRMKLKGSDGTITIHWEKINLHTTFILMMKKHLKQIQPLMEDKGFLAHDGKMLASNH